MCDLDTVHPRRRLLKHLNDIPFAKKTWTEHFPWTRIVDDVEAGSKTHPGLPSRQGWKHFSWLYHSSHALADVLNGWTCSRTCFIIDAECTLYIPLGPLAMFKLFMYISRYRGFRGLSCNYIYLYVRIFSSETNSFKAFWSWHHAHDPAYPTLP